MRCVVTAGPTIEPLDEVRRLTNFSTGRLGTELANALSAADHEVILLLGKQATWREAAPSVSVVPFLTTGDLNEQLQTQSARGADAVFHASAVSDFSFGRVWEADHDGHQQQVTAGKISTRSGRLLAELVPTPKLIAGLRDKFRSAKIFGWKYEVDGSRETVMAKARSQLSENRIDYCIANGKAYGNGFGLLNQYGSVRHFENRETLIEGLIGTLVNS